MLLPVILLFLGGAVVVTVAFVAFAFVEVAFRTPQPTAPQSMAPPWRPPIISGKELFAWAASLAKTLTLKRLSQPRDEKTARELATDICDGASSAIELAKDEHQAAGDTACPSRSCGRRMIAVAAPEALAIADAVRAHGHSAARRIRQHAQQNAQRAAGLDEGEYVEAEFVCPLMTDDGQCITYDVRPIQCRAWCKLCDSDGSNCIMPSEANGYTIRRGVENGLATGLAEAGLDGHLYEFNSALAAALGNPDASLQWAVGEPVFAGCRALS